MHSSLSSNFPGKIPPYKVQEPTPGAHPPTRSITIDGWEITCCSTHIMNALQIDEAATHLSIPLPEMTFADNHLTLRHEPSGFTYTFQALPALSKVKVGAGWDEQGGGVRVKHADEWGKTRSTGPSPLSPETPLPTVPVKPFDWTYSTLHNGSCSTSSTSSSPSSPSLSTSIAWRPASSGEVIDLELLSRPDPILYYDEIPLFESELDDNGTSTLSARVRVMPTCLFVLLRHFLRVDGVLFRVRDVRVFHLFGSNKVVREVSGWEGEYEGVKSRLPPPFSDLSPLSSSGWVHQTLSGRRPPPGVKLEGGTKSWPGLGKTTEVLVLDRLEKNGSQKSQETDQ
ncbi:Uncharacterized conserved protein [Phaffia rhodozyma]|uniref:Uncharacterized conserved protein n=1 Tax=Phaffia rhodozyma TaxID=264483 RepID=A0A0F7SFZ5_PHARH|nr:Uncharacterized conserved protein [Phaffia rhodozyma]